LGSNPGWVDVEKPSEAKTSEFKNLAQKERVGKRSGVALKYRMRLFSTAMAYSDIH
jgi:hypothetical protein